MSSAAIVLNTRADVRLLLSSPVRTLNNPKTQADLSTLNKTGHFVNGILSNTAMIAGMQPFFTWKTYRMNGLAVPFSLRKLYNGTIVNAVSGGPAEGIAFAFQESVSKKQKSAYYDLAVSSFAGAIGAPITAALERITIQQQLQGGTVKQSINRIITREGKAALFKGTGPTAGRDACYNMGIFALNDMIRDQLKKIECHSLLLSSVISGSIAGAVSTPFDLVKTRMQSDLDGKFHGCLQTTFNIIKLHGAKSLFQGMILRSGLVAGCTCLINVSKETLPGFLPGIFHQKV